MLNRAYLPVSAKCNVSRETLFPVVNLYHILSFMQTVKYISKHNQTNSLHLVSITSKLIAPRNQYQANPQKSKDDQKTNNKW